MNPSIHTAPIRQTHNKMNTTIFLFGKVLGKHILKCVVNHSLEAMVTLNPYIGTL